MNKSLVPRSQNFAFTLIELLATILIIAVLAVLVVPQAQKMMAAAASVRCIGNLKQLAIALAQYSADNDGQVIPYISTNGSYHPGSGIDRYLGVEPSPGHVVSKVWSCPANPAFYDVKYKSYSDAAASYAVNSSLIDATNKRGIPRAKVKNPGKCLLILEKLTPLKGVSVSALSRNHMKKETGGFYEHGGGNTVAFVDGHVEQWPREHPALEGGKTEKDFGPYWYSQGYP